jgi:hypothetical protein
MAEPDAAVPNAPVWRIIAGRLAPLAGVIVCTIGCVGSPVVIAALSARERGRGLKADECEGKNAEPESTTDQHRPRLVAIGGLRRQNALCHTGMYAVTMPGPCPKRVSARAACSVVFASLKSQELVDGGEGRRIGRHDAELAAIGKIRLSVCDQCVPRGHDRGAGHRLHVDEHRHGEVARRERAAHLTEVCADRGCPGGVVHVPHEDDTAAVW